MDGRPPKKTQCAGESGGGVLPFVPRLEQCPGGAALWMHCKTKALVVITDPLALLAGVRVSGQVSWPDSTLGSCILPPYNPCVFQLHMGFFLTSSPVLSRCLAVLYQTAAPSPGTLAWIRTSRIANHHASGHMLISSRDQELILPAALHNTQLISCFIGVWLKHPRVAVFGSRITV